MKKVLSISFKIIKWIFYVAVILVVILLLAIEGFDRYLSTEKGALWLYKKMPFPPKEAKYTESGVRYFEMGDPSKPPLLFIHGAPGGIFDWMSMGKNEALYERYRILVVERPGYGGTKPRKAEPSVQKQAERILEVLDNETQPAVIFGHSYGGPIAVIMGAIAPEKIERIFGVSGQYNPDNEKVFSISYFINFKIFRYLIPRFIWSSNVEKMTHPDALREASTLYPQISVPVILVHGDEDTLVYYENSPYLMERMETDKELITLEGKDHPIHMQIPDELVDIILNYVEDSK